MIEKEYVCVLLWLRICVCATSTYQHECGWSQINVACKLRLSTHAP